MNIAIGIMIPLIGTTLGAGCVLFLKNDITLTGAIALSIGIAVQNFPL